ncbi:hypothetical protein ACR3K2_31760 [Cryptosporidium serpentis]
MNPPSSKRTRLNLLKYIKGGGKTAPRIALLIIALLTCASFMTLLFHALPVLVQEIREGPTDTYKQQLSSEKRLLSLFLSDDLNRRFRSTRLLSMNLKSLIGKDTYMALNETIINPMNEKIEINLSPLAIWNSTNTNINNSQFICKKFLVSFNESILDNNGNILDKGCINHYIKATIDNKYGDISYPINRLLGIFNGILIALKDIKKLLNHIPINKGILIVFAANMEFTNNWQNSLHEIYKSWNNNTYTSQIILGSWGTGRPFRLNEHIPTLDFNFFVLNIPSINSSNQIINQTDSLEVVQEFINRFYNSLYNYTMEIKKYSKINNKEDEIINLLNINNTSNKSMVNFIGSENYFFNRNINSESDKWMGMIGVSLSKIVESLKGVIIDSVNMNNKNSFNIFGDKIIYRTYTQFVILSPVERKRIAKYQYENEYRRICLYQGHSDIKAILRASPARGSLAEYARYHGYAYFLYDSSFQKRIPKSIYNFWSRNGFYMKIFTALDILFWNITSVGEFLSKYMNNYSNNISEEKIYKKFLDENIPSYKLNYNWDLYHDGKFAHIEDYFPDGNNANGKAIQFTPGNIEANICDYAVWFDIDIAITDKHVSIERLMYLHNKDPELNTGNDTYKGVIMDVSNFVMLAARDSAWNDRYSLVNSGFVIISRSRYGLQMIFHALSLDPILAESVIKYGSNWPEQTTLSHSVFYLYNNTVSTPNMTLDISKLDIKSIPLFIINNMSGPMPFLFTSKSRNNDDHQIVVIISQRLANGFLQMPPNSFGEGPWYPGDWFIHAAASKSPFRDNALAGLLYILNSEGISSDFINYYQDACALPFLTIYNGLDLMINYLRSQLDKHGQNIQTFTNDNNIPISKVSRSDIIMESMKHLMSIKTRNHININNDNSILSYNIKDLDNDQIFTITCKWQLPLSLRWSIAETTTLAIATMVGIILFTLLYLFPHLCMKRDGHIHSMKEYTEKSIMVK